MQLENISKGSNVLDFSPVIKTHRKAHKLSHINSKWCNKSFIERSKATSIIFTNSGIISHLNNSKIKSDMTVKLIMQFDINELTIEEELVDAKNIFLDSIEFNMSDMVHQKNYAAISID